MKSFVGTLVAFCVIGVVLAQDNATDAITVPAADGAAAGPAAAGVAAGADAAKAESNGTASEQAPATVPGDNGTAPGAPSQSGAAAAAPATPAEVTAPFVPYKFECTSESDDKGPKCIEWAKSGFCEKHTATKFLFCRKTCLCTGPGSPK